MTRESLGARYSKALFSADYDVLGELRHPEFVSRWPQSGEVVRGHEAWAEITRRYPVDSETEEVVTGETKVRVTNVKTPLPFGPPLLALSGGSDSFTIRGMIRYPDGSLWHAVAICETKEGKVSEETVYFAEPFDPPEWRAHLVEIET